MPCAVPGKAELLPRRGRPAAVWFWSDGPLPVSFPLIDLELLALHSNAGGCGRQSRCSLPGRGGVRGFLDPSGSFCG